MPTKVLVDPAWKLHVGYHLNELVPFPPAGYEFVVRKTDLNSQLQPLANTSTRSVGYRFAAELGKTYFDIMKPSPSSVELVMCYMKLYTKRIPWVAELDKPWGLIGTGRGGFFASLFTTS